MILETSVFLESLPISKIFVLAILIANLSFSRRGRKLSKEGHMKVCFVQ